MTTPEVWPSPRATGPVEAVVEVPGSKSLTNRWLVLAAIATGPSTIARPLRSQDSDRMVEALRGLGVAVDTSQDEQWVVTPPSAFVGDVEIDCGQAGTVMRFVPPLAALATGAVRFTGHESALGRPVGPVLDALRQLGADVEDEGRGTLPFTVHASGHLTGGPVELDASSSSQFVTALLLTGPALDAGLEVRHTGSSVPSAAHLEMTVAVLRQVGVEARADGDTRWSVPPGRPSGFTVEVEPDLSSAAPFLALAAVSGGRVLLRGWPASTTQPGARMIEVLTAMGATCTRTEDGLVVQGPPVPDPTGGVPTGLRGTDLDLSEIGELTPVVAALAVLADGPSRLSGVAHLRHHETDRLAALVTEIDRLGGAAQETADGLLISPRPLHGARLQTYHDHRMAMFAAVVGAAIDGVEVEDVGTAAKTFPEFHRHWERAVATSSSTSTETGSGNLAATSTGSGATGPAAGVTP